jgi:hypothetical protein
MCGLLDKRIAVLATLAILFAQNALAEVGTKILPVPSNQTNADRVPNHFIVVFKDSAELARDVPPSAAARLDVAPGTYPTSDDDVTRIGLAMADRYRSLSLVDKTRPGYLRKIKHIYRHVFRGFDIDGVSDDNALKIALDPRVKYVSADLKVRSAGTTGYVGFVQSNGGITCNALAPSPCSPVPCQGSACAPWDLDRLDQVEGLDGYYHYFATGQGVIIFVIDDAENACNYDPSRMLGVVSVGATTQQDSLSAYSNYGSCVQILAPGDYLVGADNGYDTSCGSRRGCTMAWI